MSLIGVVLEQQGESRVAATPETVKVIISLGYEVVVEKVQAPKLLSQIPLTKQLAPRLVPPMRLGEQTLF